MFPDRNGHPAVIPGVPMSDLSQAALHSYALPHLTDAAYGARPLRLSDSALFERLPHLANAALSRADGTSHRCCPS